MVLIGLLLAALVCIVLGVVFASGPWFIGSLVASALAGYVLWRQREEIAARGRKGSDSTGAAQPATASRQTSLVTGAAFVGKTSEGASPDKPESNDASGSDTSVWVVDGQPQFHSETCGRIDGLGAEPVPYVQAVEDGFAECEFCHPVLAARVTQVSVIDGRAEYHAKDCEHLADTSSEQIPRAQAVDDGFTPCPDCRPDGSAPATTPPQVDEPVGEPAAESPGEPAAESPDVEASSAEAPASSPGNVWVVDGRPRYHLADCMIIKDQSAEPIALAQATEDGFMPCSMCEPNVTRV